MVFRCGFFAHGLQAIRKAASGDRELGMGFDQRLCERGIKATQDVQYLEEMMLAGRAEVDLIHVTSRDAIVRLLQSIFDDFVSNGGGLVRGQLLPKMSEDADEMMAFVVVESRGTGAPCVDGSAEEKGATGRISGDVRAMFVKHIGYEMERERGRIVVVEQVVEGRVEVAVLEHDVDDRAGCKLRGPARWDDWYFG